MRIQRFNESHENNLSDQDIIDFFSEWSDDNPDSVRIEDIIINTSKKEIYKPTTYLKDPTKIVKGKMVQLFISEPNGLSLSHVAMNVGMGSCMDNFDDLSKAIEYIKKFYTYAGDEDINYSIDNDFRGLYITFIIKGGQVESSDKETIDELLMELKALIKERYRNVVIKGNWVDVSHPKKNPEFENHSYQNFVRRIFAGEYDANERYSKWVEWKNKVINKGLTIDIKGGDYQSVFSLKRA